MQQEEAGLARGDYVRLHDLDPVFEELVTAKLSTLANDPLSATKV